MSDFLDTKASIPSGSYHKDHDDGEPAFQPFIVIESIGFVFQSIPMRRHLITDDARQEEDGFSAEHALKLQAYQSSGVRGSCLFFVK